MQIDNERTVSGLGSGKEDFSTEVVYGQYRPGITLKYNQVLKGFSATFSANLSPYPTVQAVLGAGNTGSIVDMSTGSGGPFVVPQGYTMSLVSYNGVFNQSWTSELKMDGWFLGYFGMGAAKDELARDFLIPISTALYDPTGASAHTFDVEVTNDGAADMSGSLQIYVIYEAVGTPPWPKTKTIKCRCGHTQEVSLTVTSWTCPSCGKESVFAQLETIKKFGKIR